MDCPPVTEQAVPKLPSISSTSSLPKSFAWSKVPSLSHPPGLLFCNIIHHFQPCVISVTQAKGRECIIINIFPSTSLSNLSRCCFSARQNGLQNTVSFPFLSANMLYIGKDLFFVLWQGILWLILQNHLPLYPSTALISYFLFEQDAWSWNDF